MALTNTNANDSDSGDEPLDLSLYDTFPNDRGVLLLPWGELWKYRRLAWIFGERDLKVRYRQTVIGVFWAVAQPMANVAIFLALFTLLGRQPADASSAYALVLLCGLVPWRLFSGITSNCSNALVSNTKLVKKIYFPRMLLLFATVVANTADFLVGMLLLAGMMVWYQTPPSIMVVTLPAIFILIVICGLTYGIWFAALTVMYRDVSILVPFLMQLGFFTSPVIFATSVLVPEEYHLVASINPAFTFIEAFRWAVLDQTPPSLPQIALSSTSVAITLITGCWYFQRVQRVLADKV